jgi:hypothetical protein
VKNVLSIWVDFRDNGDGPVVHNEKPKHVQGELIRFIEFSEPSGSAGGAGDKPDLADLTETRAKLTGVGVFYFLAGLIIGHVITIIALMIPVGG